MSEKTSIPTPETFDHWWGEHEDEIRKAFELAFVAGSLSGSRDMILAMRKKRVK